MGSKFIHLVFEVNTAQYCILLCINQGTSLTLSEVFYYILQEGLAYW